MSRTFSHKPDATWYKGKPKRPNNLGICNCQTCKRGRQGTKDPTIIKIKNKLKRFPNNKEFIKGAYTD